jgi:hypothetical protein
MNNPKPLTTCQVCSMPRTEAHQLNDFDSPQADLAPYLLYQ